MTKKELLDILKDVPDDAWINVCVKEAPDAEGVMVTHIGQIVQDMWLGDEGKYDKPDAIYICPQGHQMYSDHPEVHLPETHPDHDPDFDCEPERRILYDSVTPEILTPMLESEKEWPINQGRSLAE